MRFAVVLVGTGGGELHGEGVTLFAKLVFHGDLLLVDSRGDGFLVEDNIVRSTLVVDPEIQKVFGIKKWLEYKMLVKCLLCS